MANYFVPIDLLLKEKGLLSKLKRMQNRWYLFASAPKLTVYAVPEFKILINCGRPIHLGRHKLNCYKKITLWNKDDALTGPLVQHIHPQRL